MKNVISQSIPYTKAEMLSEVQATLKMENMELDADEVEILKKYQEEDCAGRNVIRDAILNEYREV
jgi:hypothetical protein